MMESILKFVSHGTVNVCKKYLRKFFNAICELDIIPFCDDDISVFMENLAADHEKTQIDFYNRGLIFADGFLGIFGAESMFDVVVDILGTPCQLHRIVLSIGSAYFKDSFEKLCKIQMHQLKY